MKFAVIGNPISHSLSPIDSNFNSLGLDDTYEALNIPIEDFHSIKKLFRKRIRRL